MRKTLLAGLLLSLLLAGASTCLAADWPQWRGPQRNGIAPDSPPLLDAFPESGPVKLWTSEDIPGDKAGGFGSVAVSDGRVFVQTDRSFRGPTDQRRINRQRLVEDGYAPDIPADFSALVEAARVSEPRLKINDKMVATTWAEEWVAKNLKPEWRAWRLPALYRLTGGPDATPLDVMAKLQAIKDRTFANQDELDAWFKANDISEDVAKLLARRLIIDATLPQGEDTLWCLDADTGKTLWKQVSPGICLDWPASSTPTVVGPRVYVYISAGVVSCLAAQDGRLLWKSEMIGDPDNNRNRSSSVLVADGLAVVCTRRALVALDADTGKVLWRQSRVHSEAASAVTFSSAGRTALLCSGPDKVTALDLPSGEPLWSVPSGPGSDSTPAVSGDYMSFVGGSIEVGLTAYKLSAAKPEPLWNFPMKDIYTSPVIHDGYVYAIGDKGRALCVELASGKLAWEDRLTPGAATSSSPVLADGKLIVVAAPWLYLINASPQSFSILGKADLGLVKSTSPAVANGKVFLRTAKAIVCCDLTRH